VCLSPGFAAEGGDAEVVRLALHGLEPDVRAKGIWPPAGAAGPQVCVVIVTGDQPPTPKEVENGVVGAAQRGRPDQC
jgi:hypothetical protein